VKHGESRPKFEAVVAGGAFAEPCLICGREVRARQRALRVTFLAGSWDQPLYYCVRCVGAAAKAMTKR